MLDNELKMIIIKCVRKTKKGDTKMERKSLYVTVTADCEDLANRIFPLGSEWEFIDEDYNDDGTGIIRYEWNGEMQSAVEDRLNCDLEVISYQIL